MSTDPVPQFSLLKYCSVREGLPGVLASLWVQVIIPLQLTGKNPYRALSSKELRTWSFYSPSAPRADPVPQCTNSVQKELISQKYHQVRPVITGKTSTSAQTPGQRATHAEPTEPRNQGTAGDRIILDSACTLVLAQYVPMISIPKFLLERHGFSGVSREYWHTGLQERQASVRDRSANTSDNQGQDHKQ